MGTSTRRRHVRPQCRGGARSKDRIYRFGRRLTYGNWRMRARGSVRMLARLGLAAKTASR